MRVLVDLISVKDIRDPNGHPLGAVIVSLRDPRWVMPDCISSAGPE